MISSTPKIRIIGRYGEYRIGEVISPPGSLRKHLLDLRVAELVDKKERRQPARKRK